MESKTIGQLKVHPDIDEWYESEAVSIPLLGGHELSFTIEDIDQDGHLTHTDAYNLPEEQDRIC